MVNSLSRYASTPVGESPSYSSFFLDEEKNPTYILGPETRSTFNENSLKEFVKENHLKEICYFIPTPMVE